MSNVTVQEALNSAILDLEHAEEHANCDYGNSISKCKAALSEIEKCYGSSSPVSEPVYQSKSRDGAWWDVESDEYNELKSDHYEVRILYTSPQPRDWVGLSDDDILDIHLSIGEEIPLGAISATEAKLKQLNTKG